MHLLSGMAILRWDGSPKIPVLIAAVVAIVAYLLLVRRQRSAEPTKQHVRLADIPRVLDLVSSAREDGTFAVFLFGERGQAPADKDALNVQFSIENGRVGLDWVLEAPGNVAARDRVTAFFAKHGAPLSERTMNDVSYLRTESGDLAALCHDLLRSVFGVTKQEMQLISEGFTWASGDSSGNA